MFSPELAELPRTRVTLPPILYRERSRCSAIEGLGGTSKAIVGLFTRENLASEGCGGEAGLYLSATAQLCNPVQI
jgi:hypothetical protein